MCGERFAFWLFIVLLFTSSSTTPRNFTSANEEDNIWEETYNYTNFIRNKTNNNNENHIVPYEKCGNITCIQLCCPLDDRLIDENCITSENEYVFPNIYNYSNNSIQSGNKKIHELFPLTVQNPCQETVPDPLFSDSFFMFSNGSLYLPDFNKSVESASYCLAIVDHDRFTAMICLETVNQIQKELDITDDDINKKILIILFLSCRIVSVLCLLTTFVVYSMLPKLRNIHSFMLRKYCILLFFEYIIEIIFILIYYYIYFQSLLVIEVTISYFICVVIASVNYFCHLANSSWLSVMSFDMWWTFRDFRLLHRNKRTKQEKKKLIYSIFAWGGSFIFTIVYIIMDFVPKMLKYHTKPRLISCIDSFWYHASRLYFYVPQSVCIISSICLSIYTALKIMRYEKDTARHLRDSESRFYNDNKRWFNLYLSLFIMLFIIMAINWIIITANEFTLFHDVVVYYIIFALSTMQDIGTFIIFVCKKTIMRQLLERLYQKCKCFSKTST